MDNLKKVMVMSGIIAYAKVKYKNFNPIHPKGIFVESTINKRQNQSDRGFVRSVNNLVKRHGLTVEKALLMDIKLERGYMHFYNKAEGLIDNAYIERLENKKDGA